ncbi:MAG TPA: hypothetical protein VFU35_03065 [Jatrophihabitans sp.]|nr:hypothetical protein [Jatrophihabitans sp.]
MIWWLIVLAWAALVGYLLYAFGKQADEVEDDAAHMYEHRDRGAYGSKFLNILIGRDDGRGVYPRRPRGRPGPR